MGPQGMVAGLGRGCGGGPGMVALKSVNEGGTMGELRPILARGIRMEQR